MAHRRELAWCLVAAAVLVAARGALFMAPGVRFDADQAIVGLMAKHISEGRAFPLFFYGQSYLPALEAYLAVPVMWLLGPTEAALKIPVVAMNVLAVLLLVWSAHRDLGLRPVVALAGALPLIVPPMVPGTRVLEAMGGNVEPLLATLLLWVTRERRWLFGIVLAVTIAQRQLTAYPVAALFAVGILHGGWRLPAVRERWAIAGVLAVAVSASLDAIRPFAAMFGPGTMARPAALDISGGDAVAAQFCLDPTRWASRADLLLSEHVPLMMGGLSAPAVEAGISSGIWHGNPAIGPWVLVLSLASLAAAWAGRRRPAEGADAGGTIPGTALPWFLVLTGLVSLLTYWLVACSQISYNSLRYDLLVLLVPTGVILAGLSRSRREVRAGLAAAVCVWCWASALDYRALAREVSSGRWPDHRGTLVRLLEERGIRELWGEFRLAYLVSFRSAEHVVVASTSIHRIDEYAARARAAHAQMLRTVTCPAGEQLVPGIWLCPPPAPEELPPVY
ncbi:MAG: hypothetical protein AB7O28_04145 [Vicinamibacterales bacterium]